MYNHLGEKVYDLVLTVDWRDAEGNLQRKYVDNFCSDRSKSADSFFTRQVWTFHLAINQLRHKYNKATTTGEKSRLDHEIKELLANGGSREFDGVTHILRTGDSGPHFHSRATLLWESQCFRDYGIVWETHTLCKRHAWSLCDAHGGAIKRFMNAMNTGTFFFLVLVLLYIIQLICVQRLHVILLSLLTAAQKLLPLQELTRFGI